MKILIAKGAGFCFGVKRALDIAFTMAEKKQRGVYTFGPLIHNPQVIEKLRQGGIEPIQDLHHEGIRALIIRTHGIPEDLMKEAQQMGYEIIDATCPFVKKAQEHVKSLSESGYGVVVVGDADHPEVQGIVSYGGDKVFVVGSGDEVKKLPKMNKIGVVAQTTQSFENLKNVVSECLQRGGEIRVFNTICDATAVRQEEATELARQVDCILVVGGFNSANTRRLAEVCAELQPRTHHIETPAEIDPAWAAVRELRRYFTASAGISSVPVVCGTTTNSQVREPAIPVGRTSRLLFTWGG